MNEIDEARKELEKLVNGASFGIGHKFGMRSEDIVRCENTIRRALERQREKWEPIETAPKDGSHIQLWRPDIQFVGYYAEAGWCMQGCQLIDPEPTRWMQPTARTRRER